VSDHCKKNNNSLIFHRLRGGVSTVLTATGQVNKRLRDGEFWPPQNRNPWADCNKVPHNWLRPREDPLNQIWYKCIHWTPCVFLQPLKTATSNLVHNLGLGLAYQKQRLGPKLAGVWARGASEKKIWVPLRISATVEASNFKFGTQLWFGTSLPKTTFRTKGIWARGAFEKYLGPPAACYLWSLPWWFTIDNTLLPNFCK